MRARLVGRRPSPVLINAPVYGAIGWSVTCRHHPPRCSEGHSSNSFADRRNGDGCTELGCCAVITTLSGSMWYQRPDSKAARAVTVQDPDRLGCEPRLRIHNRNPSRSEEIGHPKGRTAAKEAAQAP